MQTKRAVSPRVRSVIVEPEAQSELFISLFKGVSGFYLTSPTAMYLFIFIAMPSLRYNWRYVLCAGLTAAAGWTAHIEPSVVMSSLAEYQLRIVPLVLRHRRSIDKFMGDGIPVHFRTVTGSHARTADVMNAAEKIRNALIAWGRDRRERELPPLEFGIGIASGEIISGALGETGRRIAATDVFPTALALSSAPSAGGIPR